MKWAIPPHNLIGSNFFISKIFPFFVAYNFTCVDSNRNLVHIITYFNSG